MMKCGILIIGSLYWDDEPGRIDWRERQLKMAESIRVRAPIYFGRKSRSWGYTYTMTLRQGDPTGWALLLPCQRRIQTIEDMNVEAEELWKAEAIEPKSGRFGASWGVVGALFGNDEARESLAPAWKSCFQADGRKGLSVVGDDGVLNIKWPETEDGAPANLDVILAAATKPEESEPPGPDKVADAWIHQSEGHERYFFQNVRHGIRTSDDGEIWRRIEERKPDWLKCEKYANMIATLQTNAASRQ